MGDDVVGSVVRRGLSAHPTMGRTRTAMGGASVDSRQMTCGVPEHGD